MKYTDLKVEMKGLFGIREGHVKVIPVMSGALGRILLKLCDFIDQREISKQLSPI